MDKHTPTPWKVTSVPSVSLDGRRSGQVTVATSTGNTVAVIGGNSVADAELIVRAVNANEELISVLADILAADDVNPTLEASLAQRARQAVTKAEGR